MRRLGAAGSSIFVNFIPVTTLAISFARGQELFAQHYVGGLVVVGGVPLTKRK